MILPCLNKCVYVYVCMWVKSNKFIKYMCHNEKKTVKLTIFARVFQNDKFLLRSVRNNRFTIP